MEQKIIQSPLISANDPVRRIHTACAAVCQRFGFDQFVYVLTPKDKPHKRRIIHGGHGVSDTVMKKGVLRLAKSVASAQRVQDLALFMNAVGIDCPFLSYVSVPIKDSHQNTAILFLFSSTRHDLTLSDAQSPQLKQFASRIRDVTNDFFCTDVAYTSPLTKRELECLGWAVEGKTNWEIAKILGVTKRTIIFHMQNVASKLNAANRQHAIAQAVSKGIVHPKQIRSIS